MTPFHLVFVAIVFITVSNTFMAGCIVLFGDTKNNALQKSVVATLLDTAKLGTVAIIGLLGGISISP